MLDYNGLGRKLIVLRLNLTLHNLRLLLKANFNPNQPRIPAGNTGGGRWTDDGFASPASWKPEDYVDLRQKEGKRGAHAIKHHVGKTDDEIVARMGPPSKWWQPIKHGIYRNGTFFPLKRQRLC